MPAQLIDGTLIAAEILASLKPEIADLTRAGKPPKLAAIRANRDPGSAWYAQAQAKHCAANGILHELIELGDHAERAAIVAAIARCNRDPEISAILLLLPLPRGCDYLDLIAAIDYRKDAEGVHPANLGRLLAAGTDALKISPAPCTAVAAVKLAQKIHPDLSGKKAAVIGRSAIVGKPAALLLLGLNATVTIAHSHSDLAAVCRDADVLIAATGAAGAVWRRYAEKFAEWQKDASRVRPEFPDLSPLIKSEMLKSGATVIDVGVNYVPRALDAAGAPVKNEKGKPAMHYVGDVDFLAASAVAAQITAPQGGVGPVTNAILLKNTVEAARRNLRECREI